MHMQDHYVTDANGLKTKVEGLWSLTSRNWPSQKFHSIVLRKKLIDKETGEYKKTVCRADFVLESRYCNTCCCKKGLVGSNSGGRLVVAEPGYKCSEWFGIFSWMSR